MTVKQSISVILFRCMHIYRYSLALIKLEVSKKRKLIHWFNFRDTWTTWNQKTLSVMSDKEITEMREIKRWKDFGGVTAKSRLKKAEATCSNDSMSNFGHLSSITCLCWYSVLYRFVFLSFLYINEYLDYGVCWLTERYIGWNWLTILCSYSMLCCCSENEIV